MLRPKDPSIKTPTLSFMLVQSDEAIRRIMELAFRDAYTVLDATYGNGNFWNPYLIPPGIQLFTNNIDSSTKTDYHVDFTNTGLDDKSYDVVVLDPPHQADGGKASIMRERYGTIRGTNALKQLITSGVKESWRIAQIGIIVKITDHSHGGELVLLSDVVKNTVPIPPYLVLHTVRISYIEDVKHTAIRCPRNNGSTYLAFRKDSHKHRDWQRQYLLEWIEQEMKNV